MKKMLIALGIVTKFTYAMTCNDMLGKWLLTDSMNFNRQIGVLNNTEYSPPSNFFTSTVTYFNYPDRVWVNFHGTCENNGGNEGANETLQYGMNYLTLKVWTNPSFPKQLTVESRGSNMGFNATALKM